MYDLIIAGGGPAGVAAGIYAARKKIKTLLIADQFGGQSSPSADIQNFIGIKSISGFELAKLLEEHLRAQKGIEILTPDLADKVEKSGNIFLIATKSGKKFETKTFLIAAGSRRRKLNISGEEKLEGKGISYCATCDAPIFKNKTVAVIGGGNAGLEAVLDLTVYAAKIYLLEKMDSLRGDLSLREKIEQNPKVSIILNADTQKILGEKFVTGLEYKDLKTDKVNELKLDGIFVEIGSVPNSDFVKHLLRVDQWGQIIVDHKTQKTSQGGIWAAGDITDGLYKQNNISIGDAIKAVLNIYDYLTKEAKK